MKFQHKLIADQVSMVVLPIIYVIRAEVTDFGKFIINNMISISTIGNLNLLSFGKFCFREIYQVKSSMKGEI